MIIIKIFVFRRNIFDIFEFSGEMKINNPDRMVRADSGGFEFPQQHSSPEGSNSHSYNPIV
jgi:hypothetical protein